MWTGERQRYLEGHICGGKIKGVVYYSAAFIILGETQFRTHGWISGEVQTIRGELVKKILSDDSTKLIVLQEHIMW